MHATDQRRRPAASVLVATLLAAASVSASTATMAGSGVAAAGVPPPDPGLPTCSEALSGFDEEIRRYDLSPALAAQLECGFVQVPVDYAQPDGPSLRIAFSRLPAKDPAKSRGVLFTHTGGPGSGSLGFPLERATRPIGDAAREYDTVSLDYRGAGASSPYRCTADAGATTTGEDFRAAFAAEEASNRSLFACDDAMTRNLNTVSIARDIDRIRDRLKAEKMAFYGVSYGTVVGMTYRALFDDRVSRMWLESPVDPEMSELGEAQRSFAGARAQRRQLFTELAAQDATYGLGGTPDAVRESATALLTTAAQRASVRRDAPAVTVSEAASVVLGEDAAFAANSLLMIRDGGVPESIRSLQVPDSDTAATFDDRPPARLAPMSDPFAANTYRPVYCGFVAGGRDLERTASEFDRWRATRPPDPLAGEPQPSAPCAGWPGPQARPDWGTAGRSSPLMLGAHRYESTTPYEGAMNAKKVLGGSVLTSNDSQHSGTGTTACGAARITEFLRGGPARDGECLTPEEGRT